MELHCNLLAEQEAMSAAIRGNPDVEQTAYFNAVDYVKECRPLLNQGQYHLPEPPQLADFDQSQNRTVKRCRGRLTMENILIGASGVCSQL